MTNDDIRASVVQRLRELEGDTSPQYEEAFDLSTPEAERALQAVAHVLLEIRQDVDGRLARRVRLYELTLGVAVLPVLIRRWLRKALAGRLRRRTNR